MNRLRKYIFKTGIGYKSAGYAKYKIREYNSFGIDTIVKYNTTNNNDTQLGTVRPYQSRELMYLLRDIKNNSIIFDISEYETKKEFLKHCKALIKIACLNKIFIWISTSFKSVKKLLKYTLAIKKHYSEIGIVMPYNTINLENYVQILSKNNLSVMLSCVNNEAEIYQLVCNLTRKNTIPRICVYYPTAIPNQEMQKFATWHKNSMHFFVNTCKARFAIRATNKGINCSIIISFGEMFNSQNFSNEVFCSLNNFKNLCN